MSVNGKIKWFNQGKGFGFIQREDDSGIFFHISAVEGRASIDQKDLVPNLPVTFDVITGIKGLPEAVNVKVEL